MCLTLAVVPGSPLNLHQISSANTESSVVVQWESPLETGASGVYISENTVTVDGNSIESVTEMCSLTPSLDWSTTLRMKLK